MESCSRRNNATEAVHWKEVGGWVASAVLPAQECPSQYSSASAELLKESLMSLEIFRDKELPTWKSVLPTWKSGSARTLFFSYCNQIPLYQYNLPASVL